MAELPKSCELTCHEKIRVIHQPRDYLTASKELLKKTCNFPSFCDNSCMVESPHLYTDFRAFP